jgi:peptidoglycan/xylan/chitin deacetylase (PgdA/CDA1 family)
VIYPIKGQFKTFQDFIKIKGHNEKEVDPKQITNIPSTEKIVYLTFDTCPTNKVDFNIISFLQDNNIEATIFLNIDWYKRNVEKGLDFLKNPLFSIGGHGYKHVRPMHQSFAEQTHDVDACVNFIENELGRQVKLYRSPYGTPNEDKFNS